MKSRFISKRYWNFNMTAMSKSNDLVNKYDGVIDLSLGDHDFNTPEPIIIGAMEDAMTGHTHYTNFYGDIELREEICKFYNEEYDIDIDIREVMITTSGCHAMWLVLESTLDDGDEVIIHEPCFTPYPYQIMLTRGKPVYLPTYEEESFEINPKRLEKVITKKTKAMIINTPNNPTGACFTKETMEEILKIAIKYDLLIIADDVYTTFSFDRPFIPMISLKDSKKRTITINSFSKNYAMTGWRIGNVIAPNNIIEVMRNVNENNVFTAPSISQRAALHALRLRDKVNPPIVNEIKKRMYYAYERICHIPNMSCLEPKGSMYLFVNIKRTGLTSAEICNKILEEAQVLALPGDGFGRAGEGYIRLAMSVDLTKLKEAFDRIEKMGIFQN